MEQGFNHADLTVNEMTDYFKTRERNLKLREDKKKSHTASKIKEK